MAAEDQRLGATVGLSGLHEDTTWGRANAVTSCFVPPDGTFLSLTQHDGIDDEAHDVLQDEDGDGGRTLLCYHASAEADGDLNLDGEQEGWRKRPAGGGVIIEPSQLCTITSRIKSE